MIGKGGYLTSGNSDLGWGAGGCGLGLDFRLGFMLVGVVDEEAEAIGAFMMMIVVKETKRKSFMIEKPKQGNHSYIESNQPDWRLVGRK